MDWEQRFEPGLPLYMQVTRGGCTLDLSEHHGDATPGSTVFVELADARLMEVTDPFGNRLRFSEDL